MKTLTTKHHQWTMVSVDIDSQDLDNWNGGPQSENVTDILSKLGRVQDQIGIEANDMLFGRFTVVTDETDEKIEECLAEITEGVRTNWSTK